MIMDDVTINRLTDAINNLSNTLDAFNRTMEKHIRFDQQRFEEASDTIAPLVKALQSMIAVSGKSISLGQIYTIDREVNIFPSPPLEALTKNDFNELLDLLSSKPWTDDTLVAIVDVMARFLNKMRYITDKQAEELVNEIGRRLTNNNRNNNNNNGSK